MSTPQFFEKLQARVESSKSLLCIGLDPHVSQLAEPTADEAASFCIKIIEQTHPYAAAYKPNSAFFEAFGAKGFEALLKVIKAIPADIPVILDNKRGDIDTTAQAYASSSFDIFNASAVTLSPYMGWDSVQPFVTGKYADKGVFVLCKTSNPSSKDLQDKVSTLPRALISLIT
jgi:orotidine 5'-phosphate decarboxylase subfamily 2